MLIDSKINSNRIFVADIYSAENYRGHSNDFENPTYEPILQQEQVIVVKYGHFYVSIEHLQNLINRTSFAIRKATKSLYKDDRCLSTDPSEGTFPDMLYLDNVQRLIKTDNVKIKLSKLNKLQEIYTSIANSDKREASIVDLKTILFNK